MSKMKAIETINLTKYYGKFRGIVDLNLEVKKGEFFGFIGPNGAGKSTTIRTLLGLIKCSDGSAPVLGLDIEKDKEKILERVGYLPSETNFYAGMPMWRSGEESSRLSELRREGRICWRRRN